MITPACLVGLGATSIAAGSTRTHDIVLKPLGFALIAAAIAMAAGPALADEFVQAVDNGQVACTLSSRELTRISLIGDAFANVSKITSGSPLEDFTVTNEPIRGDIYLSVPLGFAGTRVSFFATSKKGFVYKFACGLGGAEATQVFVTNPAVATEKSSDAQTKLSRRDQAVRLIQAMASSATPDGYQVRQPAAASVRIGELTLRLVSEYRGAGLVGKTFRIDNRGTKPVTVAAEQIAPSGTLAASITVPELKTGEATTAYVVGQVGEGAW
ncbi:type-F conjugative transfer system secretin TraK [Sphingomonas sp. ID1715]|uniref:type-F conjugative transfer system secretin TraK n=1 Tax=Sphingomonas sp. ID1715 TaxID=1656898 RepID=UPI00148A000A|nr:type-F conjugative transfer system secretin TraK [Sphingomonas sp. ID1715]NNM77676.1 type-F conjugative transfer system secretin TraK [Sphingomonas sp. ID1715]